MTEVTQHALIATELVEAKRAAKVAADNLKSVESRARAEGIFPTESDFDADKPTIIIPVGEIPLRFQRRASSAKWETDTKERGKCFRTFVRSVGENEAARVFVVSGTEVKRAGHESILQEAGYFNANDGKNSISFLGGASDSKE